MFLLTRYYIFIIMLILSCEENTFALNAWTKLEDINAGLTVNCLDTKTDGKIFAGLSMGGVYVTSDNGENWTPANKGIENLSVNYLVVSTRNMIFISTNIAIFYSTNDGTTWNKTNHGGGNCIAINNNGDIFVAHGGGIDKSTDLGLTWTPTSIKNYQSCSAAGQLNVSSIAIDSKGIIYAGVSGPWLFVEMGIYVSYDNGENWVQKLIHNTNLKFCISNIAIDSGDIVYASARDILYKSSDNGETWPSILTNSYFINSLKISNLHDVFICNSNYGLDKVTEFQYNSIFLKNNVKDIALTKDSAYIISIGTKGLFKSRFDDLRIWQNSNNGIKNKFIDKLYFLKDKIYTISSETGNIYFKKLNQIDWKIIDNSFTNRIDQRSISYDDINFNNIAFMNDNKYLGSSNLGLFYGELVQDSTISWENILYPNYAANDIKVISDSIIFVATQNGLYKGIYNNLEITKFENIFSGNIQAIAIKNNNEFFIIQGQSGTDEIIFTTDQGKTFNACNLISERGYKINSISYLNDVLYAFTGNLGYNTNKDGIFLSTNNGKSWNRDNDGLTNLNINSIKINKDGYIFISADDGVYYKKNNINRWEKVRFIKDNAKVSGIDIYNDILYLSVSGDGIYFDSLQQIIYLSTIENKSFQPLNLKLEYFNNKIKLDWDPSIINGVSYNLYRGIKKGGPYTDSIVNRWNELSYIDTTCKPGNQYYYVVKALLDSIESENSNEVSIRIPIPGNESCWYYPDISIPILEFCVSDGVWLKDDKNDKNILKVSNKIVTINDFLKFNGSIKIDTVKKLLSINGMFYLENVNLQGTIVNTLDLFEIDIEKANLNNNIINITLIDENDIMKFKKADYLGGLKIIPQKFELFGGLQSIGVRLGGEIWIDGTKNCNDRRRLSRFKIENLEFSRDNSGNNNIAFNGGINGIGFGMDGISSPMTDICVNELNAHFSSLENSWGLDGRITLGFLDGKSEIGFGIGFIDGLFNNGLLSCKTNNPIPLGQLPIGLSGLGGSLDGFASPPKKLSLWGSIRPIVQPDLFEFELKGHLEYDNKDISESKFCLTGTGKLWNLKRQGTIDEWMGNGSISACWFWNKNLFDFSTDFKGFRIKEDDGQYGENYILKGDGSFILDMRNGDMNWSGSGKSSFTIPKLEVNKDIWCWDCPLKEFYNENIGGKSINASFDYNKPIFSSELDWTDIAPIVGRLNLKLNTETGYLELGGPKVEYKSIISKNNELPDLLSENKYIDTIEVINAEKVIIELRLMGNNIPATVLINPDGKEYNTTNSNDGVYYQIKSDSSFLWWVINNPMNGNWVLTFENDFPRDSIKLFIFNIPEKIILNCTQLEKSIKSSWSGYIDTNKKIEFYFDTDTLDFNGFFIGSSSVSENTFSYSIPDTLINCEYFLYYKIIDEDSSLFQKKYFHERIINPSPALPPPNYIKANYITKDGKSIIKWDNIKNLYIEGYYIRVINSILDSVIYIVDTSVDSLEVNMDLSDFMILISSYNKNGEHGCWNSTKVATSISKLNPKSNNNFVCIPNPAFDILSINYSLPENTKVSIILSNTFGQKVGGIIDNKMLDAGEYKSNYDVSGLPPGVYFVTLQAGSYVETQKFIIIR